MAKIEPPEYVGKRVANPTNGEGPKYGIKLLQPPYGWCMVNRHTGVLVEQGLNENSARMMADRCNKAYQF